VHRLALPLLLVSLLALAGLAAGSPQPTPVCGFCADEFEDAAADSGLNASVAESHVTVQVHENGSATWTVRNRLERGAGEFRERAGTLSAVGEHLAGSPGATVEDVRFVGGRMDGDVAVLTFRDADAAERHAGLLVVDYLHHEGYTPWYVVNADTVTVRGPPGTVVANEPSWGSVDGRSLTMTGASTGSHFELPRVEEPPLVAFGPDASASTAARADAAVALSVWPLVVDRLAGFLLVQVPVFALAVVGVGGLVARFEPEVDLEGLAATLGVAGLLGTGLLVVGMEPGWMTTLGLVGALSAPVAWSDRGHRHLRTPRRQAAAAGAGLAVVWVVTALALVITGSAGPVALTATRAALQGVPVVALLPLGGALTRSRRATVSWGALAVLGFATVPLVGVNLAGSYGFGIGIGMLLFLIAAVAFPVFGSPLVVLGRMLADGGQPRAERTAETRREDV
jgi:hypothetical protein